jgi:hypothetical protein
LNAIYINEEWRENGTGSLVDVNEFGDFRKRNCQNESVLEWWSGGKVKCVDKMQVISAFCISDVIPWPMMQ